MTKQNNKFDLYDYKNIGILFKQFTEKELKPLKLEIEKIKSNFSKGIVYNKALAGNLEKEYQLIESKNYLNELIQPYLFEHTNYFQYLDNCAYLNEDKYLILDALWVNFQKKYEFNPPHKHSGIYSFVIWLEIPYKIEDEMNMPSSVNSNNNTPGHFNFLYNNSLGGISVYSIPADKKYKNVICIFPSSMFHFVNPFYTSDDYRITVSGNFLFNVKKD